MELRNVSGGRNELCTRARKLFICNVYTIMTKKMLQPAKNISELFAVIGTHLFPTREVKVKVI